MASDQEAENQRIAKHRSEPALLVAHDLNQNGRIRSCGLIVARTDVRYNALMKNATLPPEDVFLCRAVLSQDLMKVSKLLASGKDPDGEELTRDNRLELTGYSSRLQLTMISLGMDSAEIEHIVKGFSTPKS